jgi:hypothetical protein
MSWWLKSHHARCEHKQGFEYPSVADRLAKEASQKTGELIISYRCFDCGLWHIGHADESQLRVRLPLDQALCVVCGSVIPEARLRKAKRYGTTTRTCKPGCTHQLKRKRRAEREAANAGAPEPLPTPPSSETKGVVPEPGQVDENKPPETAA